MKYEPLDIEVVDGDDDTVEKAVKIIQNGYFNVAVNMMDDEIREAIHRELAPCSDLKYLVEYMKRHKERYGDEFVI